MKQATHPNFIIGIIGVILLFIGIMMNVNSYQGGDYVIGASFVLGVIHWIWGIIEVMGEHKIRAQKENRHILWVILVVALPAIGAMLYYMVGKRIRM